MRYRDRAGERRLESTNTEDRQEAQQRLRERLQARRMRIPFRRSPKGRTICCSMIGWILFLENLFQATFSARRRPIGSTSGAREAY